MIIQRTVYFSLFLLLVTGVSGKAQIVGRPGDSGNPDIYRSSTGRVRSAQEAATIQRINDQRRSHAQMDALRSIADRNLSRNSTPRQEFEGKMKTAKRYIAPDPSYREKYKSFLNLPNTGIVKLFSVKPCTADAKTEVKDCPYDFIYGQGRYFSFRSRDYVVDKWADIENVNGFFVSNGVDNQGVLVNIGDIGLDKVTLDTKGVDFLKNFAPSDRAEQVSKQYMEILDEIESDEFRFAKSLPIEAGKTYGLRVVAYERDVELVLNEQQKKMIKTARALKIMFDPLSGDKRQDVIVVFRVLEKSENGAVTIIWKELQRKRSPYLKAVKE